MTTPTNNVLKIDIPKDVDIEQKIANAREQLVLQLSERNKMALNLEILDYLDSQKPKGSAQNPQIDIVTASMLTVQSVINWLEARIERMVKEENERRKQEAAKNKQAEASVPDEAAAS